MGTKLGNLQIRGASVEEVSALLPKALVGQWAEGVVSVYHEDFQWGTVEREGKKLSRKLPGAVVLAAALFDDDVVSFELFQAGKRLTAHLLNPYEEQNILGKPGVFCEALGLPAEDEKRLKVLWKKGDACEQLEMTALLLGLPLWADAECLPEKKVVRDIAAVDAWIAERPDPPKIKSVSKAEVIQELQGLTVDSSCCSLVRAPGCFCQVFALGETEIWGGQEEIQLWAPAADGTLHCAVKMTIADNQRCHIQYYFSPKRILAAVNNRHNEPIPNYPGAFQGKLDSTYLIFDSDKRFPLPLLLSKEMCDCIPTADGGIWTFISDREKPGRLLRYGPEGKRVYEKTIGPCGHSIAMTQDRLYTLRVENGTDPTGQDSFHFFCYDGEGNLCGEQDLPWNTELMALDREGGLWLGENLGRSIVHLDRDLNILSRSSVLTSERDYHVLDMDLSKDKETVFLTSFKKGIFLLDAKDLSILQAKMTRDTVYGAAIDGQGRFWAGVSESTLEAYDRNLQTISRHRLKGSIMTLCRNDQGDLMAYTHDRKRNIFRVYRIA